MSKKIIFIFLLISMGSVINGDNPKCHKCNRTVYPVEKMTFAGLYWHQDCFKCYKCNKKLTLHSAVSTDGKIYCKNHIPKPDAKKSDSIESKKSKKNKFRGKYKKRFKK